MAMPNLHAKISGKLVEIEELLERAGNTMPNITLFARNPNNDKMSIIISSELSDDEIRKAFEIVMTNATKKSQLTETEAMKALV